MNIGWKIVSKDQQTHSMVVEYTGDFNQLLNIPIPPADKELEEWVRMYLPQHVLVQHEPHSDAVVGACGSFTVDTQVAGGQLSEQPNVVGSWNEEYIRALIYTVLEEIRESTV
jgi:hypothetical protein